MTEQVQEQPPKRILVSPGDAFVPILEALADFGLEIITMTPQYADALAGLELPGLKSLAHFREAAVTDEAYNWVGNTIAANSALLRVTQHPNLASSVKSFMQGDVRGYLAAKAPDLALVTVIIDNLKPDLVLLHNDVEPLTKVAALWAQANGKPCLHVPHSIYQEVENPHDIHAVFTASHLASSGAYQSQWFVARGFNPQRIVETGLPQFDAFANPDLNRLKARAGLGLPNNRPVVTYCSSWSQNTNMLGMHDGVEAAYLAILQAAKLLPEAHFVIKLHPRARADQWHVEQAEQAGVPVTVIKDHLSTVLAASDVVFAYGPSNVLLEAANYPFLKLAASSGFERDNEIAKIPLDPPESQLIRDRLAGLLQAQPPDYSDFLWRYLGRRDGKAHERIVQVCLGLLESQHGN